jgi:transposase-like protein
MTLNFTSEQVTKILTEVAKGQDGFHQVMQITFEALMRAERQAHLTDSVHDKGNGYRERKFYGNGRLLELRVPRTRQGNFYPILLGLLKEQQAEAQKLAYSLYSKGLTTTQVGDLFEEIYGRHYSKSAISGMFDYAREEVEAFLHRNIDSYYPIIMIDATFISTRREDRVSKEAYYTVLGVRKDRTREVLSIINFPTESAGGWEDVFQALYKRGLRSIGLLVSDALNGIENALASVYSGTAHQLCVIHLQRNVNKKVKPDDKDAVSADLKAVFQTIDPNDKPLDGIKRFQRFCDKWEKRYPFLKALRTSQRLPFYFTYLNYHPMVRSMIYSTNWSERLNRDYKRVVKMRGALPSPDATILLLGGVAINRPCFDRKVPKLNYENELFEWDE